MKLKKDLLVPSDCMQCGGVLTAREETLRAAAELYPARIRQAVMSSLAAYGEKGSLRLADGFALVDGALAFAIEIVREEGGRQIDAIAFWEAVEAKLGSCLSRLVSARHQGDGAVVESKLEFVEPGTLNPGREPSREGGSNTTTPCTPSAPQPAAVVEPATEHGEGLAAAGSSGGTGVTQLDDVPPAGPLWADDFSRTGELDELGLEPGTDRLCRVMVESCTRVSLVQLRGNKLPQVLAVTGPGEAPIVRGSNLTARLTGVEVRRRGIWVLSDYVIKDGQ